MRRRAAQYGFTLVEALTTLTIFSFFTTILVLTMVWGFRAFSLAVAQADVATEARRISLFIERELRNSTYVSTSVKYLGREVGSQHRDALCFVSRNDWSDPSAYDVVQNSPNWTNYFIYYATKDLPTGRLIRLAIDPDPDKIGSFAYPPFINSSNLYLKDDVPANYPADVTSTKTLATSVYRFQVKTLPATQELDISVLLRENGIMARHTDGRREGRTFELQYRVHPQNSP